MTADDRLKDCHAKYSQLDVLGVDTLIPRVNAGLQKGALKQGTARGARRRRVSARRAP